MTAIRDGRIYRAHRPADEHQVLGGVQRDEAGDLHVHAAKHFVLRVELEHLSRPDERDVPRAPVGLHLHVMRLGVVAHAVAAEIHRA